MKENILKIVTTLVFAVAGFLGFNELTNPEEITVWAGLVTAVAGVGGYYAAKLLKAQE